MGAGDTDGRGGEDQGGGSTVEAGGGSVDDDYDGDEGVAGGEVQGPIRPMATNWAGPWQAPYGGPPAMEREISGGRNECVNLRRREEAGEGRHRLDGGQGHRGSIREHQCTPHLGQRRPGMEGPDASVGEVQGPLGSVPLPSPSPAAPIGGRRSPRSPPLAALC